MQIKNGVKSFCPLLSVKTFFRLQLIPVFRFFTKKENTRINGCLFNILTARQRRAAATLYHIPKNFLRFRVILFLVILFKTDTGEKILDYLNNSIKIVKKRADISILAVFLQK